MEDGGAFNPPLPQIGDRLGPFMLEAEQMMMYGHKRYARYNYSYFKDKLPMPPSA